MISKIAAVALGSVLALSAQTAVTVPFRALLCCGPVNSGNADLLLHLVEDASGVILSGSVDIAVAYQFPNDTVVTGLGIAAAGGTNFVIETNITASAPVQATAGSGRILNQVQVLPGNQIGLLALKGLLANPGAYSVRVVTANSPAGDMTGAVQTANMSVLMGVLSSSTATGAATVTILYTGSASSITSGEVTIQASYQFPAQVTFSGLRIYTQQGQLALPAGVMPGTQSSGTGAGTLTAPATEIDMSDAQMVQTVKNILAGPGNFSVQLSTVDNPSAPLTGQLRGTDFMSFPIPAFADSGVASIVGLHTLRANSGGIVAGTVTFDVNYRFSDGAQISQLDLDGSVIAPTLTADPSGFGNAYALVSVFNGTGLASLNDIVSNPEAHQINLHTTTAATSLSAALAAVNDAPPVAVAVIPIVEVVDLTTFAPGELVEIYGSNLAKVTSDLSAWPGGSLPSALNGVSVLLSGHGARVLYVSPGQVDALMPFGSPIGSDLLTVTNANGTSAPVSLNVAAVAPAVYNFAFKNADFSLVGASNPAHAGDVLVFYTTGMGQTTPALATGQIVPLGPPFYDTAPVTVTIGGVSAEVIYSIAAPPYVAGLYQMAVTVPAGVGPGSQPMVAISGGLQSNTVNVVIE